MFERHGEGPRLTQSGHLAVLTNVVANYATGEQFLVPDPAYSAVVRRGSSLVKTPPSPMARLMMSALASRPRRGPDASDRAHPFRRVPPTLRNEGLGCP